MADKMLTVHDVCERLNVHEATCRRWLKSGTLKGTRLGGKVWRIPESALTRMIEAGQVDTGADVVTDAADMDARR